MTTETPNDDRFKDPGTNPTLSPAASSTASPDATADIAVRTEDVWKIYAQEPEDVEAVRGVSLEVREGDFMTMAGPSGSGKTTLLNMLGGLTRPTRGRIWVRDLEITTLSNKELARLRLENIGFVFQAFNLLPVLSALENAEFFAPPSGCAGRGAAPTGTCALRRDRARGLRGSKAGQALGRPTAACGCCASRGGPAHARSRGRAHGQSRFAHE